ncbi:hypothetical protein H6G81_21880 [Scytonema hofmannii FACHB-248]|uniref:Uncharacterized protein n=1 Tax=Scytonema hofmannii FACHB-248 TaxID=1842502 RepID=A0ABR8GVL3_9CYAN|nr:MULTISPECIES: hypothetical protein [Nostocales]MBD2607104.1 hypothetical protein [Scytonema hofmannii FACHB-248]
MQKQTLAFARMYTIRQMKFLKSFYNLQTFKLAIAKLPIVVYPEFPVFLLELRLADRNAVE